jgi:hypothetical protein
VSLDFDTYELLRLGIARNKMNTKAMPERFIPHTMYAMEPRVSDITALAILFAAHAVLALTMKSSAGLATVHSVATIVVVLGVAMLISPRLYWIVCAGAYLVGAEVLWRMCGAAGPWELSFLLNCRLSKEQIDRVLLAVAIPIFSVCFVAAHGTFSRQINWRSQSVYAASGNFGPNQVAAVLGLGSLILMLYLVRTPLGFWHKVLVGLRPSDNLARPV